MEFPFYDSPDTATVICCHILEHQAPILYVSHDEDDGMWQFLCGETHETDEAKLVQYCANNSEYSTCYLHQSCVVVSQQCHRIASFLRLVLSQISGTVFSLLFRQRCTSIFKMGF